MGPAHWAVIYLILAVIVALVASKKGRSGWAFFGSLLSIPIPLMILVSFGFGSNMESKGFAMWSAAFLCPLVGFIVAIMAESAEQAAITKGEYGNYKKCPFCAESVRAEAIKCKHCGSTLTSA